jgi:hypothetical protein
LTIWLKVVGKTGKVSRTGLNRRTESTIDSNNVYQGWSQSYEIELFVKYIQWMDTSLRDSTKAISRLGDNSLKLKIEKRKS